MTGYAQGNPFGASGNQIRNFIGLGQQIRDGARREFLHQQGAGFRKRSNPFPQLVLIRHMQDQGIELRPVLGFINFGNGLGIQSISCQTIYGLCWNGHQLSFSQQPCRFLDIFPNDGMVHKKMSRTGRDKVNRVLASSGL